MSPLNRTIPFRQVACFSAIVSDNLDLDVTRFFYEFFQIKTVITESSSCFLTSSGAMYDGVPQNIFYFWPSWQKAAKPKSMILTNGSSGGSVTSTLRGVMSRWMMPRS